MSNQRLVAQPKPGRLGRMGSFVLWYTLPALALLGVGAYIAGAILWHANPPVVPVAGGSMRPALQPGDLVVLKGVLEDELEKGDVIAFNVPDAKRGEFGLPGAIVHRIIEIEKVNGGPAIIHTKGDANGGEDAFTIRSTDVIGRMAKRVPAAGYPLLFFRSRQGKIFIGAAIAVVLLYFLLGVLDRRRELADVNMLSLATIVVEARELKETMQQAVTSARGPPGAVVHPTAEHSAAEPAEPDISSLPPEARALHLAEFELAPAYRSEPELGSESAEPDISALPAETRALHLTEFQLASAYRSEPESQPESEPAPVPEKEFSTALVPYVPPVQAGIDFAALEAEIHRAVVSSADVSATMRELVGAIGDYGEHLRSHTAVMQNLAVSTGELHSAASEMRQVIAMLTQVLTTVGQRQLPPEA